MRLSFLVLFGVPQLCCMLTQASLHLLAIDPIAISNSSESRIVNAIFVLFFIVLLILLLDLKQAFGVFFAHLIRISLRPNQSI